MAGLAGVGAAAGGARVQVPHRSVEVGPGERLAGWIDDLRELVDQLAELPAVRRTVRPHQVEQLAAAVAVLERQRRVAHDRPDRVGGARHHHPVHRAAPVVRGDELHVHVVGEDHPAVVRGPVVVAVVVAGPHIDVADQAVEAEEGVEGVQVHVVAVPLLAGAGGGGGVAERVPVGRIEGLGRALAFLVAGVGFDRVDVAVLEAAFVEEVALARLDAEVEPPQVALVLRRGRRFGRVVDHAQVQVGGAHRGHAGDLVDPVRDRFLDPGGPAVHRCPRAGVGIDQDVVPGFLERSAEIVVGLVVAGAVEVHIPLVLARQVGRPLAAHPELDVVVHLAAVDHRAVEAAVLIGAVVLAVGHVRRPRDQVERSDRFQQRRGIGLRRSGREPVEGGRPHRPRPGGYAGIGEVGEVRLLVVGVRHALRVAQGIGEADLVAHQPAVDLERPGQHGGVHVVARHHVAVGSVVKHGDRRPSGGIGGIVQVGEDAGGVDQFQRHVAAGIHRLVGQRHRAHAVGVGDLGGDGDGVAGHRRLRRVLDLADLRRDHVDGPECAVGSTRGGGWQRDLRGGKLGIEGEIAAVGVGVAVQGVERQHVGAALQVKLGAVQYDGGPAGGADAGVGGGVVGELAAIHIATAEDFGAVDPGHAAVVDQQPQGQRRGNPVGRHGERLAPVDRGVVGKPPRHHVRERGVVSDRGPDADRGPAGQPSRVVERDRPPVSDVGRRGFGRALEVFPVGGSRRNIGVGAEPPLHRRLPRPAEVVVERGVD